MSIDPIALAGSRARGKRPYFFKDPDVERVLSIAMVVAMEHAVTRQRLDALERLIEQKGLFTREELEQFRPDAAAEAQRTRWTQAMQGGGMDVPVEEVMDVLRKE